MNALEDCAEYVECAECAEETEDSIFVVNTRGDKIGPLCAACKSFIWMCQECHCALSTYEVTYEEYHAGDCGGKVL